MGKWIDNLFKNWGLNILNKKVNKMASKKKSTNTTMAGVGMALVAVGTVALAFFDGDPTTVVDFKIFAAEIIVAWGLFKAKDSNATHSGKDTE